MVGREGSRPPLGFPEPRDHPPLNRAEVHLWWTWPARSAHAGDLLSAHERVRRDRLLTPELRAFWGATRAWLRRVLAPYAGLDPRALALVEDPGEKPRLRRQPGMPDVRFNLSHSDDLAVLAVADGHEVGVDVEAVKPRIHLAELIDHCCSLPERERLERLAPGPRLAAFLACWTRKEAILKGLGMGLAVEPASLTVSLDPGLPPRLVAAPWPDRDVRAWSLHDLALADGYVATLAVQGHGIRIRRFGPAPAG